MLCIKRTNGKSVVIRTCDGDIIIRYTVDINVNPYFVDFEVVESPPTATFSRISRRQIDIVTPQGNITMFADPDKEYKRASVAFDAPKHIDIVRAEVLESPEKCAAYAIKMVNGGAA